MTLTRIEIVNRAKYRAGVEAGPIHLTNSFDELLLDITTRYPVMKDQLSSGNTVASQAYVGSGLPTDYRQDSANELMICNNTQLSYMEPEEYFYSVNSVVTVTPGAPADYTVDLPGSKVYLYPTPDAVYAYKFYYTRYHAVSTSDTYQHLLGGEFDDVLIAGLTAKACELTNQYEKAIYWQDKYEKSLFRRGLLRTMKRVGFRSSIWDSNYNINFGG